MAFLDFAAMTKVYGSYLLRNLFLDLTCSSGGVRGSSDVHPHPPPQDENGIKTTAL